MIRNLLTAEVGLNRVNKKRDGQDAAQAAAAQKPDSKAEPAAGKKGP